jgi:hypothetical protein
MSDKPEVGFQFGVEGDQSLLATVRALREELKNVQKQQESTASSADLLHKAWSSLIQLGATIVIAKFARDVFETAVSLGKLSQITGVSTETLSVYYKAAKDVGVAHEAVDKGLARLSRSFVMLQAGNKAAAQGFALLHLSAKDFVGLGPDEKIRKVTDAFAGMKEGPEKAAAAIALLGKAGQQLIPVFNQLGAEEFAKVADQAQRLGLIFTQGMAEGALRAKASLADLEGVAEGVTAQFETGLLPAVADAADGIVAFALESDHANKKGENSFKSLGESVGWFAKATVLALILAGSAWKDFFLIVGVGLETIGRELINVFNTIGGVIIDLGQLKLKAAWQDIANGGKEAAQGVKDAWKAAADSIADSNARAMAAFDQLFPATPKERKLPKHKGQPGDTTGAELEKNLGRTEASGLKQQAQDELALYKALTQQKLEEDKRAYDQGLISLKDYFDLRRGAIQQGFVEELKALGSEKAGLQDLLAKAEAESTKTPQQDLAKQNEILRLKQQIAHVDAQEAIELTKRDTELEKNETERAKAKQDHLLKELEEQKKLADLEGDRAKSAQLAIQIEDMQVRKELEQIGRTEAEIDAFMARYSAARGIRTAGAEAQKGFEGGEAGLANKKAALQEQVADYQLQPYQAERQLRAEYEREIPILQKQIDLLRQKAAEAQKAAEGRGEKGPNAEAVDLTKQADQDETKLLRLQAEMVKMDTTWMSWRTVALHSIDEVSTHLTTGLNGWIQGHQRFGAAMKQMWNGMVMIGVESLEKIAAKWIAQHLRMLLIKVTTNQLGVASDATAAAQKNAIESTSARKSLFKSAASAAGKAWDAMANIPYVGPILGAIAAAVTFAGIMALGAFAKGGYVGRGAPAMAFAGGGQMAARSMLGGGFLRGPGSSTSDSIPAMLSDKEYVVSAKGVSNIGVETLDAINKGAFRGAFLPPIRQPAPYTAAGFHMASGGIIKSLASPGGGNGGPTIHNHNAISSSSIDSKDFRDHIDDHMDYIADGLKDRMRNFRF